MTTIYELIQNYNAIIQTTLTELQRTDVKDRVQRDSLLELLKDQFTLFSQAKENSFYAELARFPEAERPLASVIKNGWDIIERMEKMQDQGITPGSWEANLQQLASDIEQLVAQEEKHIITLARAHLDKVEESELAQELEAERHVLEGNDYLEDEAEHGREQTILAYHKGKDTPGNTHVLPRKQPQTL
jgi:hypothetical protein